MWNMLVNYKCNINKCTKYKMNKLFPVNSHLKEQSNIFSIINILVHDSVLYVVD